MAGGAAINGGTTRASGVLGQVRCSTETPHLSHEPFGVVVLVGTDGLLIGTGTIRRHCLGVIPLPGARRLCDAASNNQGMVVIHEHVPPVAGQCRVSVGLAGQQRGGIRAEAVGLVAELDAAEITLGTLLALLGRPETLPGS